jgi:hypothetical protein
VFGLRPDDPLIVLATLWRGAMIDRYATIEYFVDRSLAACAAAGILDKRVAAETLPRKRCQALITALDHELIAVKASAARKSIAAVHARWDERNALCHGRIKPASESVTVVWTAHDKNETEQRQFRVTPLQMLEKLSELDRLKTVVGSQLGGVDKLCADLAS